jgi:peptide/nickel transport system permease protein
VSAQALPRLRVPSTLVLGGTLLVLIATASVVGIWITPYDPAAFSVRVRLQPPSALHPFGTDEFGRDVLSRVLAGAHLSLATGFGAMAISLLVGVPLGLLAAFHRGIVQEVILRSVDLVISLPPVLLGLLEEDFVQAARARGEGAFPILWHEILPNAWPPIIVECGLRVTFAILLGSALSFLGLGPQPPASEWGLMIAEGRDFLTQAPWVSLAPGLCLCVLLVSVNLVGEGLRERLDPHLSGRAHA